MSAIERHPETYSPEWLLRAADTKTTELVGGQLLEKAVGAESSEVASELEHRIRVHASRAVGWTFGPDTGYQCFPKDPKRVRKPDVSFVRRDRLPERPKGWITIAPDLAVEVLSPRDRVTELESRIADFFEAGTPLFWVIDPEMRQAQVRRPRQDIRVLGEADSLDGAEVMPGFACRLADLLG